ncbi:TetR/AcrR family transcriptional regulator [Acinetobacter terrestris]|uniref:TetR/AcrR family transcriptional regulator n=1 Tax=Acinetobacter terrestris TaxID=2529843 RepID=UPI00103883FE|nr:TetR/AcrR family transcriptional regulator [Acinetobacter terrestris]TCB54102.1 TetR/AcrR family transcriptional regulator [Acinetobacter terrestris]
MQQADLLSRMYPGRRAELKRILLQHALDCFSEFGIEATSIEMIRARADSSVGAIYHHFKNKEGMVGALFGAALQDQLQLRTAALAQVQGLQQGLAVIIAQYIDWVVQNPDFAQFLFMARLGLGTAQQAEIAAQNQQRNQAVFAWLQRQADEDIAQIAKIPRDLLLSLILGATESYCRAWLSHKVSTSPILYKQVLIDAAWNSVVQFSPQS